MVAGCLRNATTVGPWAGPAPFTRLTRRSRTEPFLAFDGTATALICRRAPAQGRNTDDSDDPAGYADLP
ncbi:hypothetical protein GCM10010397_71730 [Streptomyces spinoverrucosus]|nr:hypothetical protein GCM10010397_71730 [Streptomyces spinoverrucosus]